jgi:hypothetical protein
MKWYGLEAQAKIEAGIKRNLEAACITVENHAKKLLSIAGTGTVGRDVKGKFKLKRKYGYERSKPGEPPRKQKGHLRRSVAHEVIGLIGRVGTNYEVGRWLELGTSRMAARPWLRRSFAECQDQIRQHLSRPVL